MVLSPKNQKTRSNSDEFNDKRNKPSWTQVVSKNIVSVRTGTMSTNLKSQSSALRDASSSKFATRPSSLDSFFTSSNNITPWIKGLEENSVLIDVTSISDISKLKKFFNSFNSEDSYIYFGRLPVERKYLQRTFIETAWDVSSDVYTKLCSDGLTFEDNTNIKGYRSLPSDAQIARVRVERLPLIHPVTLREQMERRFSAFGEVLDIGFIKDGECFVGQGYVVLNLNPIDAEVETFEKLSRVIDWIDGQRDLLLTWDEMPPYCRFCQKEDHCRADCKELLKTKHCFNCNEKGHIIRDCPRRTYNPPIVAHKRIPVQTRPVSSRGESIQLKKPLTLASVPENRHLPTASVEQNILQNPTESAITQNHQPQCSSSDGRIHIAKRAKHNIEHYHNDKNDHLSESVGDDDHYERFRGF